MRTCKIQLTQKNCDSGCFPLSEVLLKCINLEYMELNVHR